MDIIKRRVPALEHANGELSKRVPLTLTQAQFDKLKAEAKQAHIPATRFIRQALFKNDRQGADSQAMRLVSREMANHADLLHYLARYTKARANLQEAADSLEKASRVLSKAARKPGKERFKKQAEKMSKLADKLNSLLIMDLSQTEYEEEGEQDGRGNNRADA